MHRSSDVPTIQLDLLLSSTMQEVYSPKYATKAMKTKETETVHDYTKNVLLSLLLPSSTSSICLSPQVSSVLSKNMLSPPLLKKPTLDQVYTRYMYPSSVIQSMN